MRGGGDRKDRDTKVLKLRIFGEKISDEKRPEAGKPQSAQTSRPPWISGADSAIDSNRISFSS